MPGVVNSLGDFISVQWKTKQPSTILAVKFKQHKQLFNPQSLSDRPPVKTFLMYFGNESLTHLCLKQWHRPAFSDDDERLVGDYMTFPIPSFIEAVLQTLHRWYLH